MLPILADAVLIFIAASLTKPILQRSDVEIGRTDPNLASVGYRTLLRLQLAERYYKQPGPASSLVQHAAERNIRPNAAELRSGTR